MQGTIYKICLKYKWRIPVYYTRNRNRNRKKTAINLQDFCRKNLNSKKAIKYITTQFKLFIRNCNRIAFNLYEE